MAAAGKEALLNRQSSGSWTLGNVFRVLQALLAYFFSLTVNLLLGSQCTIYSSA